MRISSKSKGVLYGLTTRVLQLSFDVLGFRFASGILCVFTAWASGLSGFGLLPLEDPKPSTLNPDTSGDEPRELLGLIPEASSARPLIYKP